MTTWVVAELPKDGSGMAVVTHKSLEFARDDFFDRYNQVKSNGQTILNFELEKEGEGLFETNGTMVWMLEASPAQIFA